MGKKIRVWDGTAWQDVAPSLPYTAIHSAQASMPLTGVDGQVWLDTDGTLAGQDFVPLSGGTMTGNLNTPSINSGGIAGQNYCINGNFDIFQRTSFTSSSAGYCLDRWYAWSGGASMTVTQQTSGAPLGSKYYMRVAYNALNVCNMWQFIEHDNVKMLQGKTVTLSAKIRRNSAFTPNYVLGLYKATTANAGTSATWSQVGAVGAANVNIPTGTSANDWFTFSTTVTVPADGTAEGLAIVLFENAAGPSGAYIEISQVKLEIGSSITPITRAGGTIAGELAACQRYYYKSADMSVVPGSATFSGLVRGGTNASGNRWIGHFSLPVTMRTAPSCIVYNPTTGSAGSMRNEDANTNVTVSGIFGQYQNTITQIDFNPVTSANNVVVGYIVASAEL
jgi:hypothetical protein